MLATSFIKPRNAIVNKLMGQKVVPLGASCDTLTLQIQASDNKRSFWALLQSAQYTWFQK